MRAVPFVIAAALVGCAFAVPTAENMHKNSIEAVNQAAGVLARAGSLIRGAKLQSPVLAKEARLFDVKQSAGTCDQTGFADATARVLQACPSLSGLVSGTTSLEDFLPGFCGSECQKTLSAELPKYSACLTSSTAFLIYFIDTCNTKPECFSEGFIKTQSRLEKTCGDAIDAVTNFANYSTKGITGATNACAGTCITDWVSLMRGYPQCLQDPSDPSTLTINYAAMANVLEGLCVKNAGDYCAIKLKGFGKFQCSSYSQCNNDASWCDNNCLPEVTDEHLGTLCTSCLTNLMTNVAAFGDQAESLASSINMFCSTAKGGAYVATTNPYCFPLALTAQIAFARRSSYSLTNTTQAAICDVGYTASCLERISLAQADLRVSTANANFRSCLSTSYSYYFSYCLSSFESSLRSAASARSDAYLACAQNNDNNYCLPLLWTVYNGQYSCGITTTAMTTALTNAGCCLQYYNEWNRYDYSSYQASYLPSGRRTAKYTSYLSGAASVYVYYHTSLYAKDSITRDEQPADEILRCLPTAANTSDFWNAFDAGCPTILASPPSTSLPVMISWSRASRSAAVKAAIEDALTVDVANAMGIAPSDIVNGTLSMGSSGAIKLRNTTTLARRQSSSTDAACVFKFGVDAATTTEASAAIGRLSSALSADTFTSPAASAAVQSQCFECLDARSDTLVKADENPSGGSSGGSDSSANAVAVLAAAAVAVALAMF
jgi:hypothetical protein